MKPRPKVTGTLAALNRDQAQLLNMMIEVLDLPTGSYALVTLDAHTVYEVIARGGAREIGSKEAVHGSRKVGMPPEMAADYRGETSPGAKVDIYAEAARRGEMPINEALRRAADTAERSSPAPEFGFDDALRMLKAGFSLQRAGWNGKGMFVYHVPASAYPPTTAAGLSLAREADGLVTYGAYIAMKTATGEVVPWLASQTDLLADDWRVL